MVRTVKYRKQGRPTFYATQVIAFKQSFLAEMLARYDGNRTETAKVLGLNRTMLCRLIREYGVEVPAKRKRKPFRNSFIEEA